MAVYKQSDSKKSEKAEKSSSLLRKIENYAAIGLVAAAMACSTTKNESEPVTIILPPSPTPTTQNFNLKENANPQQGGVVAPGSGTFQQGQNVSISETPNAGYQFINWQGSGNGSYTGTIANPPPITMNNNIKEVANFQLIPEALTIENNGCISVSGAGNYSFGSTAQFSASVPTGSSLNWTGVGANSYTGTSNPASVTMDNPINETANCSPTQQQFQFTEQANPLRGGSVFPGSGKYQAGQQIQIEESPAPGYSFIKWQGFGNDSYSGPLSSPPPITVSGPVSEFANFKPTFPETLTVLNEGCQQVFGGGSFPYGTKEPFSATIPQGGTFNGWTGEGAGSYTGFNNPAQVTLDNNITEIANCNTVTSNNNLYVLTNFPSSLSVINSDQLVTTVPLNSTSYSMAPDPIGINIYVGASQGQSNTVETVSAKSNSITNTFTMDVVPSLLAFNSDIYGTALYVTGSYTGVNMQVINQVDSNNPTIVDVSVPIAPTSMAFTQDGLNLYIAGSKSSEIAVMSTPILQIIDTISVTNAAFLSLTPNNTQLYASQPGNVSVIDTMSNEVIGIIGIPGGNNLQPGKAVFTSDGTKAYVANSNEISVIDTTLLQVTATIPVNTQSGFLAMTQDSNYVYAPNVVNEGNNNYQAVMNIISTSNNNVVASIPLGNQMQGPVSGFSKVIFSPDGTEAYIAGGSSQDKLFIIDTNSQSLKTAIPVPANLVDIAEVQK